MGIGTAVWPFDESGEAWFVERFSRWAIGNWPAHVPITCLDVGANEGGYSELILAGLGGRADIHCFEPATQTYARLAARLGDVPSVELHRAAVGRVEGTATLHTIPAHGQLASLVPFERQRETVPELVPMAQLDAWAVARKIERIALLKIDVEGAELDALAGAADLLAARAVDVVQFEYGARNLSGGASFRMLAELLDGYTIHRLVIDGLRPVDPMRDTSDIPVSATNYVAVAPHVHDVVGNG
jgi:FkbM family methyltransferase